MWCSGAASLLRLRVAPADLHTHTHTIKWGLAHNVINLLTATSHLPLVPLHGWSVSSWCCSNRGKTSPNTLPELMPQGSCVLFIRNVIAVDELVTCQNSRKHKHTYAPEVGGHKDFHMPCSLSQSPNKTKQKSNQKYVCCYASANTMKSFRAYSH